MSKGGRKQIIAPESDPKQTSSQTPGTNAKLIKAVARAYRWQHMLETGRYTTMRDLAAAEEINPGYISRLMTLTLLAPQIVEAILDGVNTSSNSDSRTVTTAVWSEQITTRPE